MDHVVVAARPGRTFAGARTRIGLRAWAPTAGAAAICMVLLAVWSAAFYAEGHPVIDHTSYEEQARQLRAGHLTIPIDADRSSPEVRLTAPTENGRVFKYLPGTAALGAASLTITGDLAAVRYAALLGLVVATAGVAATVGWSPRRRAVAAGLVGASPVVLSTDAVLLSYVPALALLVLALWLVLRATVGPSSDLRALVLLGGAGLVLGGALLVRQIEVLAWLLVLCSWCALRPGPGPRQRVGQVAAVLGGTVPGLAVLLAFNHAVTGDALSLPFTVVSPNDGLGWGLRRVLPGDALETFRLVDGFRTTPRATFDLLMWTLLGPALAAGAVAVLWVRRHSGVHWLLAALFLSAPVGYLFHWANAHAVRAGFYMSVGPFYYLTCLPPLVLLGVDGLARLPRRAVMGGLVLVVAVQTVFVVDHLHDWTQLVDQPVASGRAL
jgi:hypothetical protein